MAELLAGASDADGDTLSVQELTASTGVLTDNFNGTWNFTPALDDTSEVSFSFGVSDGQAITPQTATLDLTSVNDAPIAVADIFTGAPDLAAIAFSNGLKIYVNDGSGAFASSGQSFANSSGLALAAGDINGDGYADIVTGSPNGFTQQVYLNDGSGHFAATSQSLGINQADRIVLGDMNGDGSLDIIADGPVSQIWLNNGSGIFTASSQSIGRFQSATIGDVDGDGSLDLVTGPGRVLYNDGTGSFTDSGQALGADLARALELADLDGDHDLDLVQGNYFGPIRVLLNNGSGVFKDTGQALDNGNNYDIALGDVNDDGFVDIVSVGRPDCSVSPVAVSRVPPCTRG